MIALIPTIWEAPQLPALVTQLLDEGVKQILLTVNREDAPLSMPWMPTSPRLAVIPEYGSIYDGWNVGIRYARIFKDKLAILNDDIELAPNALAAAERMMDDNANVAICGLDYRGDAAVPSGLLYVEGTYQYGGIHGCAFIVDPNSVDEVDRQFEWWYGDDDLVRTAVAAGKKVAIAEGCRVIHQGETTAVNHPWTHGAKIRDAARFAKKWGDA